MSVVRFEHPHIFSGRGRRRASTLVVDTAGGRILPPDSPVDRRESLPGRVVVPGFIDTHAHLSSLGGRPGDLELRDVDSPEALLAAVAARARSLTGQEAWVTGTGWVDRPDWGGLPRAEALEAAASGRPVALFRRDRHALLASRSALDGAGLTAGSPDPPGGRVVRDASGTPSGLLIDSAMDPVTQRIPAPNPGDLGREAAHKARQLAALGVTCVHEAWVSRDLWRGLLEVLGRDALPIRVRAMLGEGWAEDQVAPDSPEPDRLRAIAVKAFADGALGSRGAQLERPYADADTRGLAVDSDARLTARADLAQRLGLQLAVHAIGDAGFSRVLALFEARAGAHRAAFYRERRWRIEHAQLVQPRDLSRLEGLSLALQPVHFWADAPWAGDRLGRHRLAWSHRLRSLLEAGAHLGFGSDYPIESADPRLGLLAAGATRHPEAPGWDRAGERLSRDAALHAYWRGAAWLAFDERDLGALDLGRLADFVCLDTDPFSAPDPREIGVVATYVGGRRLF